MTHYLQYPPGTTKVYSYFESRGGKFDEVCFFGLQYILKEWMVGRVVSHKMIDEAKEFYKLHFNGLDFFNETGWRYIVDVSSKDYFYFLLHIFFRSIMDSCRCA